MNFGESRIEASLAGHGSRRAIFDQLANVLHAPSRDAFAELDGLWIAPGSDSRPPCRPTDRDRATWTKDLLEAKEARFR